MKLWVYGLYFKWVGLFTRLDFFYSRIWLHLVLIWLRFDFECWIGFAFVVCVLFWVCCGCVDLWWVFLILVALYICFRRCCLACIVVLGFGYDVLFVGGFGGLWMPTFGFDKVGFIVWLTYMLVCCVRGLRVFGVSYFRFWCCVVWLVFGFGCLVGYFVELVAFVCGFGHSVVVFVQSGLVLTTCCCLRWFG